MNAMDLAVKVIEPLIAKRCDVHLETH